METLFIGKNMLFLPDVESTNTYAMSLLRNVNILDGTLVYTDNQTHGKGQRGAGWQSDAASNITCSIILKTTFLLAENSFYLSKITALAVYDLLTEIFNPSQYDIKIKWPNDIFINKKKIAGILIENVYHQSALGFSVIGVGININQTIFKGLENLATSFKQLTGNTFNRNEVLNSLCRFLEKWYLILKGEKLSRIDAAYHEKLWGWNSLFRFSDSANRTFEAVIMEVAVDGKIHLKMKDNTIKDFDVKELKFLY